MKRHIVWLMACGVLAGCASEPSPIDAPPAPTASHQANEHSAESAGGAVGGSAGGSEDSSVDAPAAFHFKSGTLEIGDFDPYALGDDIFDPCTEISPEEFAAAGFDNVEIFPEEYSGLLQGLKVCDVAKHNDVASEAFGNNNANRAYIEDQIPLLPQYKSSILPEIFVFGPKNGEGTHCYAQVDTVRGGLVSQVTGLESQQSLERACEVAIRNLETIFLTHSG